MSEKKETKAVYAITERAGRSFFQRVGSAWVNADSSLSILIDCIPLSGKLQVRSEEREQAAEQAGRTRSQRN